jgi:hypothetical protein
LPAAVTSVQVTLNRSCVKTRPLALQIFSIPAGMKDNIYLSKIELNIDSAI